MLTEVSTPLPELLSCSVVACAPCSQEGWGRGPVLGDSPGPALRPRPGHCPLQLALSDVFPSSFRKQHANPAVSEDAFIQDKLKHMGKCGGPAHVSLPLQSLSAVRPSGFLGVRNTPGIVSLTDLWKASDTVESLTGSLHSTHFPVQLSLKVVN